MCTLPCRRASCYFSFPCFPQDASSLLAYKSGFCHHTDVLLLSFGSVLSLRMPAILDGDEAIRKWLDFAEVPTQEAVKLIQPTENIVFHPVSTFVNNIRNNTPECVAPVELGVKKEIKATPSNKVMLGWLKSSQEGSPQKKENYLPKWTSQFIPSPSPKKTSADVLQQWLGKQGQPAAKKHKA